MSENLWHASWLNNLKLRFKAALAIGGLAALFGITAVAFLSNQREMVDARKWNEHTDRVMDRAHELQVIPSHRWTLWQPMCGVAGNG
jgi:hypothetical protein